MNGASKLAWRQVIACMMIMTASGMVVTTYGVVSRPFAAAFHPPRSLLMLALTIMAAIGALSAPFYGALMDRRSVRTLAMIGAGTLAFGFFTLSFVTAFWQVLAIYGLLMAPSSILAGPLMSTVLLSRWFTERRGRAIGLGICGIALGSLIFPPIIQHLYDALGWQNGLRALALIVLLLMGAGIAMIVDRPDGAGLSSGANPHGPIPAAEFIPTRVIITDPSFWRAVAIFAVVLSGMQGMVTNLVPLAGDHHITPDRAALLVSIYAATGLIAKLSFAAFSDRFDPKRFIFVSLTGFGIGMASLITIVGGYPQLAFGAGMVGGFGGVIVPMQGVAIPLIFDHRIIGRAGGLLQLCVLCALLVSPPLFGMVFDLAGTYGAIFLAYTMLAVIALVILRFLRFHQRPA